MEGKPGQVLSPNRTAQQVEPMGPSSTDRLRLRGTLRFEALWNLGIVLLILCALTVVLFRTAADPDLWGHLRFGLDIIHSGQINQVDPYSYLTQGQRWINHEWLSEVLFALAWSAGGSFGLILLKVMVGFTTVGILYYFLRREAKVNPIQAYLLLLLGSLPIIPFLFHLRPQMFTYLFFAVILLAIYKTECGEYRWLYAAPFLIALWGNIHGGVLAGLGVLCLWSLLRLLAQRQEQRRVILLTVISIGGILVNPYGSDLLIFLLRTATIPRPEIEDWQPLALVSPLGFMYLSVLVSSMIGVALSTQKRKPIHIILFGTIAFLPWVAMRHLPLFSIAAIILVSEHIVSAWNKIRHTQQIENRVPVGIASLPFIAAALVLAGGSTLNLNRIHLVEKESPPVVAVTLLKLSGISGNLATEFSWGEYVLWHLGPAIKVSIDGRRETIYSQDVYRKNISFMFGAGNWDAVLKDYPTDMALVKKSAPDDNLLKLHPEWILVFEDTHSVLYAKRNSSVARQLMAAANEYTPIAEDKYFP